MRNKGDVAQSAHVCIRLGHNTLPERTVTSKEHCKQLNWGLISRLQVLYSADPSKRAR